MAQVTQIVYKKNGQLVKTNYNTAIAALTDLRSEIAEVKAKLEFGQNEVKVKLVQALPLELEENTFYLVSETLAHSLDIDKLLADVNKNASDIAKNAEDIGTLNTAVESLRDNDITLQGNIDTLNTKIDDTKTELQGDLQTYKEEMTEKLSSVYNFRGSVATESDLANIENPKNGDVYNTEDTGMNFAYVAGKPAVEADPENGVEAQDAIEGHWDPLGFDLTHIATKAQLDNVETTLSGRIKTLEDKDSKNYDAEVEALHAEDTAIKGRLDGHDEEISGIKTRLDTDETDIQGLKDADTALDERIDALEADTHKVEVLDDTAFGALKEEEVEDNTMYLVTEENTVTDESGEKTISDVYTLYAGVKAENTQLKGRVETLESELQAIKARLNSL